MFSENITNRDESFFGHFKRISELTTENLQSLLDLIKLIRQLRETKIKMIKSEYVKRDNIIHDKELVVVRRVLTNYSYNKFLTIIIIIARYLRCNSKTISSTDLKLLKQCNIYNNDLKLGPPCEHLISRIPQIKNFFLKKFCTKGSSVLLI